MVADLRSAVGFLKHRVRRLAGHVEVDLREGVEVHALEAVDVG